MSQMRAMRAKPRAGVCMYLIAYVGVAVCCAACGQTGPLTLAEPDGGAPDGAEQVDPERDDAERDDSEQDTGER